MLIGYNRSEDLINAERLAKHLCDDMCEVSDFLGIQSQFLRYAKMTARTRNIDLDIQSQDYFRAWTLRGTSIYIVF